MEQQINSSSVLCIVLFNSERRAPASEGDFLGAISLGCVMENMWLMTQSLGIAFHVVSSLSQSKVEKRMKQLLNIPTNLKIAFSFRLGYPLSPLKYLRVRRDIKDFTHYNGY
jgi:nitroreductase